jgi:DNA transposition AAA+ family ATPase
MRPDFVETNNVREFHGVIRAMEDRGAVEACIVVVDGKPGLGKTTTMARWVAQTGSVYVRANIGWDYRWFISDLLTELGFQTIPYGKIKRYELLIKTLADRAQAARMQGKTFTLIIDECDLVSSRGEIMEAIRGISDIQSLPTILVGMGKLRDNLRRFPQIESRAPRKVEFLPATLDDTHALMATRCEVPVAEDLVAFIWKVSKGYNREILEAIAHVERAGLRLDPDEAGISMADMAGQVIMNDRDTGKPIHVPEAI